MKLRIPEVTAWLAAFLACGCSFYHEKNPGDPSTITVANVSYARLYNELFVPRCSLCHGNQIAGAGINTLSYDNVIANLSKIEDRALNRKSMPPDSPLTPYELTLLSTWIQAGTPQHAADGSSLQEPEAQ